MSFNLMVIVKWRIGFGFVQAAKRHARESAFVV